MPLLSDSGPQKIYARAVVQLYKNWNRMSRPLRCLAIEDALRECAQRVRIPMPIIRWANQDEFTVDDWTIVFDVLDYKEKWEQVDMQLDKGKSKSGKYEREKGKFDQWVYTVTVPYHELCHVEQHTQILYARLNDSLPWLDLSERTVTSNATLSRVIARELSYPQWVVRRALDAKATFRNLPVPTLHRWYDSHYGGGKKMRERTRCDLRNVLYLTGDFKRRCKTYSDYRNLPDEFDAYLSQSHTGIEIKKLIMQESVDQSLLQVANLLR